MILVLDNYDSFTYNLVQYLQEMGREVKVVYSDRVTVAEVLSSGASHILLSPGPGRPADAGISLAVINQVKGKLPILGVCLGHQCIGQAFGSKITNALQVMHGKTSMVYHNNSGVFAGLKNPLRATRYHSLIVDKASLSSCLEITAWTGDAKGEMIEIMGIQHKEYPIAGVQFHPESILSEQGHALLKNFLEN